MGLQPSPDAGWHRSMLRALACCAVIIGALVAGEHSLRAQSLADVARREKARRAAQEKGRTYTDTDLPPVDAAPPPVAPPSTPSPAPGTTPASPRDEVASTTNAAASEQPAKAREKRDEPYWRARAKALHDRIAKANADVAATRSRLDALDAAPPSPANAQERAVTAATIKRLQDNAQSLLDELGRFNALTTTLKIPADWIR